MKRYEFQVQGSTLLPQQECAPGDEVRKVGELHIPCGPSRNCALDVVTRNTQAARISEEQKDKGMVVNLAVGINYGHSG